MKTRTARRLLPALLLGLSACASAGSSEPANAPAAPPPGAPPTPAITPTTPPPAPASPDLAPPAAALRTADHVELTGLELGTMWTFENPPLDYWQRAYGFVATPNWLEHVRLASVRYATFCSASFVSGHGLAMTNHHCARSCVDAISSAERDYVRDGFKAEAEGDELLCPGVFLDQLIAIEDVTARVQGAGRAGATGAEVAAAQQAMIDEIEAGCEATTSDVCQVVSLFHGGQYQLYTYRRYEPVKLVFAPELQAGFFGGDPDNFTYPRYALDVSFVRAYEADSTTPATTPHHFAWSAGGAREGDLTFITGNPGGTDRQATVAQLMYEARARHPFIVDMLAGRAEVLHAYAARGPEEERAVRGQIFGVENSLKAYTGQLGGLRDTLLMGRKIKWESGFQQAVGADPNLESVYGEVWARLAAVAAEKAGLYAKLNLYNPSMYIPAPQLQLAGTLVRYVDQLQRPAAERDPAFQGEALAQLEARLRGPSDVDVELGTALLAARLELATKWLPPGDILLTTALRAGETPEEAARRLVSESAIGDATFRAQMLDGGSAAVAASDDPLVALARVLEPQYQKVAARWGELGATETVQEEQLANALFAVFGTDLPPDATFTLRISDGVVKRYPYNGTFAPPVTTIAGMYARAAEFSNQMPWTLPGSFVDRQAHVRMETPFNFVSTNDITGGNSGSPMINRDAEIVGIAFDGNIEQLPNEFLFSTTAGRTVSVHSAGIIELLGSVYGADALVAELRSQADD